MESRESLVRSLLALDRPLDEVVQRLGQYPWDSAEKLEIFRAAHAESVLKRFADGKLLASEVEAWANAIEGREDVGYEPSAEATLRRLIFELANPLLTHALTKETAVDWRRAILGA